MTGAANPWPTPPSDDLASLYPQDSAASLATRTLVMGILNVTPDSFFDGGRSLLPNDAVRRAGEMESEGADLIDIGGQSTRPGSDPVSEEEEWRRVGPVLEAMAAKARVPISIDTTRSAIARRAVRLGVRVINDVSGLRADPELARVAADSGAFLVVMHSRANPKTMQQSTHYDDLLGEVKQFLLAQTDVAMALGVRRDRLIIDPGLGFAKTPQGSIELLRRLGELLDLGYPILSGPSRKSFLGWILGGIPADKRLEATLAAATLSAAAGARIVRVHDVRATVRAVRVADAVAGRFVQA